jgi:hypothetical protein
MGDSIQISDKGETKVAFNEEFDDVDLLSPEEKAALEEDVDLDGPAAETKESDSHTREADRQKAEDEAKAAADKAEAEAKAKADEDAKKAKADEDAKALADAEKEKEAAATDKTDDGKIKEVQEEPAKIVPDMAPPTVLQGLSEEQLKTVRDGLEKAKKDFSEGVIDYDEYLDARDGFNQQIWQHNLAQQVSAESVDTRWEWEQETFLTDDANAWINDDEIVYRAFATTVNAYLEDDDMSVLPGPEILSRAREEVAKRFSPASQQERLTKEEEDKKNEALENAKKAEANKQSPETLGGKPAAEIDEGVGEFDWLDKLDGEAYEKAVSNLTEAQMKRYEASG